MRGALLALAFVTSTLASCGLFEDPVDRLDSSQAVAVCEDSCDRQGECDEEFDVGTCRDKCDASVAAWYLCPEAPEIRDYIEMCNAMACDEVAGCLDGRPEC